MKERQRAEVAEGKEIRCVAEGGDDVIWGGKALGRTEARKREGRGSPPVVSFRAAGETNRGSFLRPRADFTFPHRSIHPPGRLPNGSL